MYILGIETSCDDTCCSIIEIQNNNIIIKSNEKQDQFIHSAIYGGVMPSLSLKNHCKNLPIVFEKALSKTGISQDQISIVCSTIGPGMTGSLHMGSYFGVILATKINSNFIPVHHIEAHLLTGYEDNIGFPFLSVIISGGHSIIVACYQWGKYKTIVTQLDDAAGEVFDKVGREIGFPFPCGVWIEKCAENCNSKNLPILNSMTGQCFFSFSGIKTGIKNIIKHYKTEEICYITQETIGEIIKEKLKLAVKITGIKKAICSGGVLANKTIRKKLQEVCECFFPSIELCGDNGFMIAKTGYLHWLYKTKMVNNYNLEIFPRMSLECWSKLI